MQKAKKAKESLVIMSELVLPNDTNMLHNLMGGRLLHWMDIAAGISAQRHCNNIAVTASVDNVSFRNPVKLGDVVTIQAKVTRSFHTSMEVRITVYAENIPSGSKIKSNEAFYTFVALNDNGQKTEVPELIPETEEELALYNTAMQRRELRLVLAGKMRPDEASSIKSIFS
ncbi:acyl-CoA thioesterase [Pseudopedobacter sp.]|uniref:acyl-CoA thioesterase n=1 Tax=Pseudopedobacter sp. TaxID=1936787 RepID=UPI00333F3D1F